MQRDFKQNFQIILIGSFGRKRSDRKFPILQ